jgi:hypothetical protein
VVEVDEPGLAVRSTEIGEVVRLVPVEEAAAAVEEESINAIRQLISVINNL